MNPVLEQLGLGKASIHIHRIELYLAKEIMRAAKQGNSDEVKALSSVAEAIKDYIKLTGIPSLDLNLFPSEEEVRNIIKELRKKP